MKHFNLSEWALSHQQFCYFIMALVFFAGALSYFQLGRDEDPPYTIRTMLVSAVWPGASAQEVEMQITDKLEKKLRDTPCLDYLKSYSKPGVSVIYVNLDDYVLKNEIPVTWKKESHQSPAKWYDGQGGRLRLNIGKTWVCVYEGDVIFE